LLLPDAACSDRVRLLNKILAEPSIELRKLLLISRTRSLYDNRCREKSADDIPKFSAEDSGRYNSAVTET
jgi:hypothetical protein